MIFLEKNFKVSVIIPVYNAAKFVRNAVESAVNLEQVGEIILVEDGSPDNALELCVALEKEFRKVKLFQHPKGENRGAGASRNLGIRNAEFDYVAFLDADDIYLPERFKSSKYILSNQPHVDGVYEPIGFMDESGSQILKTHKINSEISSKRLFHYLIRGKYGHFSTIAITVRKSIFSKAGYFNEDLKLHQDSELWLRMAYHGSLISGGFRDPVALARQHDLNRFFTTSNVKSNLKYWLAVKKYFKGKRISLFDRMLITLKIAKLKKGIEQERSLIVIFSKEFMS